MSQTISERTKELQPEMEQYKDRLPFGKFQDGVNKLEIDPSIPVEKLFGKFGEQVIYTVTLNGEKVRLALSKSVEIPVLKGLVKKKTSFTITKKGTGMNTRYRVN